jgi:hypothetical protein
VLSSSVDGGVKTPVIRALTPSSAVPPVSGVIRIWPESDFGSDNACS